MTGARRSFVLGLAAAGAAASLVVGVAVAPVRAGASVVTGSEAIVRPGTTAPLDSGGSATPYGVAIPIGASCPGDTAHDQYRVYSVLVPAGVSLDSVSYKGDLPARWYGFIAYGAYFGAVNTAPYTGQIVGIPPAFTFSRLTPTELFPGRPTPSSTDWVGGIACVNTHGVVTNAWTTQFRFVRDLSDPGGFRWTVLHPTAVSTSGGGHWLWIGIGLVAASVAIAAVVLLLGRRPAGPDGASTAARTPAVGTRRRRVGKDDRIDADDGGQHQVPTAPVGK